MTLKEQIIQDAVTGKLTGTPFVPGPDVIEREMRRRTEPDRSPVPYPVRSDMTSSGEDLVAAFEKIETDVQDMFGLSHALEDRLARLEITERYEMDSLNTELDKVEDDLKWRSHRAQGKWTSTIGEHFRDMLSVDLERTTLSVYPSQGAVRLPATDRRSIDPGWGFDDVGRVTVLTGQELIEEVAVESGSSLRLLIDGQPTTWNLKVKGKGQGTVTIDVFIPLYNTPRLNRIDLNLSTPIIADVYLSKSDGQSLFLARRQNIPQSWTCTFPAQEVTGLHLIAYVTLSAGETSYVRIAEMGFQLEEYRTKGTLVTTSLSHETNTVIGRIALSADEIVPDGASIKYWVGLDPLVSGSFVNSDQDPVPAGLSAIAFELGPSGTTFSSTLRDWSHLPGASGFQEWEPEWVAIQPGNRKSIASAPPVAVPEHMANHAHVSGFASRINTNHDYYELEYLGTEPGWWRPYVGNGEMIPDPSQSSPDRKAYGSDFYFVHYWPPDRLPIEDSIRLMAGTATNRDGEITSSGALWSVAQRSSPEMSDVTISNLEADVSGLITHTSSGSILFDTVRNLRFIDSQDEPFIRGHEYFVYGSGNYMEVDVGVIGTEHAVLGQSVRPFEITYTAEFPDGVSSTYLYNTIVRVDEGRDSAYVTIRKTDLLYDVRFIHISQDFSVDQVEVVENPGAQASITRRLREGFTRIILTSSSETYDLTNNVIFTGAVGSFETPAPARLVSPEKLMRSVPRYDHSHCALVPAPSGGKFLMVNDPGGDGDRVFGNVSLGPSNTNTSTYLFRPGASGLVDFYTLSWDEILSPETNLLVKVEMATQNAHVTPILDAIEIDTGAHLASLTLEDLRTLDIDGEGGIQ